MSKMSNLSVIVAEQSELLVVDIAAYQVEGRKEALQMVDNQIGFLVKVCTPAEIKIIQAALVLNIVDDIFPPELS